MIIPNLFATLSDYKFKIFFFFKKKKKIVHKVIDMFRIHLIVNFLCDIYIQPQIF
jgi:hypothetical protein